MNTFKSDFSGAEFPDNEKISAGIIRHALLNFIQKEKPEFDENSNISVNELNSVRERYISKYLSKEIDELSDIEKKIVSSVAQHTTISDKLDEEDEKNLTFGEKLADNVANFGGSWTFILSFIGFLVFWILLNVFWFANKGFDPYPFILLNLILSCIAAIQAPVIMMSQNRQEFKDRQRSKKDYMINMKSELEIRTLHEKIDHLILHQQQKLLEVQKVQIDLLNDIMNNLGKKKE